MCSRERTNSKNSCLKVLLKQHIVIKIPSGYEIHYQKHVKCENEMQSNIKIIKVLDWQNTELLRARTDVTTYFLNYHLSSFHCLM